MDERTMRMLKAALDYKATVFKSLGITDDELERAIGSGPVQAALKSGNDSSALGLSVARLEEIENELAFEARFVGLEAAVKSFRANPEGFLTEDPGSGVDAFGMSVGGNDGEADGDPGWPGDVFGNKPPVNFYF